MWGYHLKQVRLKTTTALTLLMAQRRGLIKGNTVLVELTELKELREKRW